MCVGIVRRLEFWTSRNRPRLALALIALLGIALALITAAAAWERPALRTLAGVAVLIAFVVFLALALGIRHASGSGEEGGGVGGYGIDGGG